jgi:membrane-associated protease RseP (regulator of RpoE activity)
MKTFFTAILILFSAVLTIALGQSTVHVKIKKEVDGKLIAEEKVFTLEEGQDLEEALKLNGIDKSNAREFSISIENNSPSSEYRKLELDRLDLKGFPFDLNEGTIKRPYLGITLKNDQHAAIITEVNPMSPAESSNLKAGDRILKIDDLKVKSAQDFVEYIQTKAPGEEVEIKVKRNKKKYKIKVQLGVGQNGGGSSTLPNIIFPGIPETFKWEELPFKNESYTAFLGVMPNNQYTASGVQVDSVIQGSAAEKMGILKGDIIIAINGNTLANFDELRNYIAKQQPKSNCEVTVIREDKTTILNGELGTKPIIIKDGLRIYKNEKGLDDQGQLNLDYELDWENKLDSNLQILLDENGVQLLNGAANTSQIYIENYPSDVLGLLKDEVITTGTYDNLGFIPDNEEKRLQINLTSQQPGTIRLQVVNQDNLVVLSDERGEKTTSYQQSIRYAGWKKGTYLLKVYHNDQLSLVKKLIIE